MLGRKERSQLELFISRGNLFPMIMCCAHTIVTLDAGYGVARVFAELEARRIEAIVPTRREPSPKKGVIPARRFKLDARHDRLRCPRGRHLVPHSIPCPLRAACFSPNAQRRTVL